MRLELLDHGYDESSSLSRTRPSHTHDVLSVQHERNGLALDGSRYLESLLRDGFEKRRIQAHGLETSALLHGLSYIGRFAIRSGLFRGNEGFVVGSVAVSNVQIYSQICVQTRLLLHIIAASEGIEYVELGFGERRRARAGSHDG
jgi:hypothetical protein